jgi:hypothetical protein
MSRLCLAVLVGAILVAGCSVNTAQAELVEQAATHAREPLAPAGAAVTLQPEAEEQLGWAASVVRVDFAPDQNFLTVKLFGLAGGDPAMNGLYTYIAFSSGPHEGWRVFRIGDFLDYSILSAAPGRIDLELRESTMNSETSEIGARTRRVIVSWTPGGENASPTTVAVTPAQ